MMYPLAPRILFPKKASQHQHAVFESTLMDKEPFLKRAVDVLGEELLTFTTLSLPFNSPPVKTANHHLGAC